MAPRANGSAARLPKELRASLAALESIEERARTLARNLEDLHSLAYDRVASGEGSGGRKTARTGYYLDEVGVERAKDVLRAVTDRHHGVVGLDKALAALEGAVNELFRASGGEPTMRGTLLGEIDPETGQVAPGSAKRELAAAVQAQKRRRERGEYTPARTEPQPGFRWRG